VPEEDFLSDGVNITISYKNLKGGLDFLLNGDIVSSTIKRAERDKI
jgi:hypothetical protein